MNKDLIRALIILVASLSIASVLIMSTSPYTESDSIYELPTEGAPDSYE